MSFNGNTFKYDGRGRRIKKNDITYLYDSQGNLIKQSNGLEFYYDIDGIAACKYNGTMYYYMTDAQGNVIGIVDRNGNVVVQYWYDAWGNHKVVSANGTAITSSTHIGNVNPFRYRGYYYDTETGLYFLQTRYYDPEVGRFLNRDSVQYADPQTFGGLDLYAYCLNNPVEYVDPDGTFISLFIGLTVSFIIGFGTSTISQGVQYGWDNINWAQSAVDGLFSVASTALAATGINFLTSIGIGMISGFSQYAIDSNFHNESLNLEGAISAIILGGAAGALSGAGASNGKVLAQGMSGRASTGMKALITTVNRYGMNSIEYRNIINLYGKAISTAVQNTINKAFTASVIKIWGSTIVMPAAQYLSVKTLQLLGL